MLALVTEGKTNKEIAGTLGLSEKTIKNYLSHAFEKLNVTRRAQAAVRFMSDARYLGATIASASAADRVSARAPQASRAVMLRDPRLNPPLSGAEPRSA